MLVVGNSFQNTKKITNPVFGLYELPNTGTGSFSMWTTLPDDLLMRLAEMAPLLVLVVLRKLERRCACIHVAKERLESASCLIRAPFKLTLKQIFETINEVHVRARICHQAMEDFSQSSMHGIQHHCQ